MGTKYIDLALVVQSSKHLKLMGSKKRGFNSMWIPATYGNTGGKHGQCLDRTNKFKFVIQFY